MKEIVYIFVDEAGDMDFSNFRKYERGDLQYYSKIKQYIFDEEIMTKKKSEMPL